jgi:hypothetical protein
VFAALRGDFVEPRERGRSTSTSASRFRHALAEARDVTEVHDVHGDAARG